MQMTCDVFNKGTYFSFLATMCRGTVRVTSTFAFEKIGELLDSEFFHDFWLVNIRNPGTLYHP